jgi:hypothetical protein
MIRFGKTLFLLMGVLSTVGMAHADAPVIPGQPAGKSKTCRKATAKRVSRQRAVKNNQAGEPVMVMELTMTQVEAGHQVNLEGVLLEMRKSVQKGFFRVAIKVRAAGCMRQP